MNWVLIIMATWADQSFTIQVPITKDTFCNLAKAQAATDLLPEKLSDDPAQLKIAMTCLQVR